MALLSTRFPVGMDQNSLCIEWIQNSRSLPAKKPGVCKQQSSERTASSAAPLPRHRDTPCSRVPLLGDQSAEAARPWPASLRDHRRVISHELQ